jgi:hypothetical protein
LIIGVVREWEDQHPRAFAKNKNAPAAESPEHFEIYLGAF